MNQPAQRSVTELLDEIEQGLDLHADSCAFAKRYGHPLVKALRRAVELYETKGWTACENRLFQSEVAQLLREPVKKAKTASNAELHPRVEQCVKCHEWTSDWVDPDGAGGRICRYCEAFPPVSNAVLAQAECRANAELLEACVEALDTLSDKYHAEDSETGKRLRTAIAHNATLLAQRETKDLGEPEP